jgi:hypothetical protein
MEPRRNATTAHDLVPISAAVPGHLVCAFQAEEEVVQEQGVWSGMMMKKKPAQSNESTRREDESNLDSRYGAIGISAVAAALPYRSEAKKNQAYAASDNELDKWIAESAAA